MNSKELLTANSEINLRKLKVIKNFAQFMIIKGILKDETTGLNGILA